MATQHTPTPWKTDAKGVIGSSYGRMGSPHRRVADCRGQKRPYPTPEMDAENAANAAFIVRACNAHEDLLREAKALVAEIDARGYHNEFAGMRAAIAKAEGK